MYSLSNFQVCNTVLLTIVITLYIMATCIHLIYGSLYPLITFTHFPQWPWKQPMYFASMSSLLKVVVQSLSCIRLFATPCTAARQASLSFTISQSLLKLMSIESVMPSNYLILCHLLLLLPQSFPASGSFPMSQFFASGGQSIGASASASVLPVNIQG